MDVTGVEEIKFTRSCGCVFCDIGFAPVKMKRQYVHYHRRGNPERTGAFRIIVCHNEKYNLKGTEP